MKLAISGKGGTGKTTLSAGLARVFASEGYRVYAIDADPDANLASMLGITEEIKPLIELEDIIAERVGAKGGIFTLNPDVDDILEDYAVEHDGVNFLRMGSIKAASSACYCPENSFLRSIINSLVFYRDEVVIMDMGAGIEHLTRGTAAGVDWMLVVCEPSRISIETAGVIDRLAREAGIARVGFIGNKIRTERERQYLREHLPGEILALVDYDETLLESGLEAVEDDHPPMLQQARVVFERLTDKA
ncbi:MAG: AAA family ATPase [Bacillota bacterium]